MKKLITTFSCSLVFITSLISLVSCAQSKDSNYNFGKLDVLRKDKDGMTLNQVSSTLLKAIIGNTDHSNFINKECKRFFINLSEIIKNDYDKTFDESHLKIYFNYRINNVNLETTYEKDSHIDTLFDDDNKKNYSLNKFKNAKINFESISDKNTYLNKEKYFYKTNVNFSLKAKTN